MVSEKALKNVKPLTKSSREGGGVEKKRTLPRGATEEAGPLNCLSSGNLTFMTRTLARQTY